MDSYDEFNDIELADLLRLGNANGGAKNLQTPVLLLHGEGDPTFPV